MWNKFHDSELEYFPQKMNKSNSYLLQLSNLCPIHGVFHSYKTSGGFQVQTLHVYFNEKEKIPRLLYRTGIKT